MAAVTVTPVVTTAGAQPTPPDVIRETLVALISAQVPGYTANLPGSMIEDMLSTEVASISQLDDAFIEAINSISPTTALFPILNQLGACYGSPLGQETNTSVNVTFTGPPGQPIQQGFIVGDGTYQYVLQDGGVIPTGGTTVPLFAVATQPGSWAVLPGTVTELVTQFPAGISVTVTNPLAGTPSSGAPTEEQYRTQVLRAGRASSQGMQSYLKSLLTNPAVCPGVVPRLVSVVQIDGGGWEVIVGGGDPYQIAYAINQALFDISLLVGSTIAITGITNANPGVVTTNLNHGLTTGQSNVHIAGVVGMSGVNGGPYTVTVIDEKTFSFGVNTTGSGSWTSGGVVTPNPRNIAVNIADFPNTYTVNFVQPPLQTVIIQCTWNTNSPNYVSPSSVSQIAGPPIVNYINSIPVGQPINEFELDAVFQAAVVGLIPTPFVSRLEWTVSINGVATSPTSGTGLVFGDPESYFYSSSSGVTLTQG